VLQEGLENGTFSKTSVERVLSRRLSNKKPGTAMHKRTSAALSNLKAGKPLTANVWPTKPKASAKPKAAKADQGFTLEQVGNMVAEAVAAALAARDAETTPDEPSETADEANTDDTDGVEIDGVTRVLLRSIAVGSDDEPHVLDVYGFTEGEDHPDNAIGVDNDGFMVNDQGDFVLPDGSIEAAEYNSASSSES
jgi:hypothetical protein